MFIYARKPGLNFTIQKSITDAMTDPCDIEKGLADIKSQFQRLRADCGHALNGPNSFFDQLRSDLQLDFDGVVRQPVDFSYQISDESDDEVPTRAPVLTRIIQPFFIFDRKALKRRPEASSAASQAPPPEIVVKPIMMNAAAQCGSLDRRSCSTQSEEKFGYVDEGTVALTSVLTQTRGLKQRHEATNTESVLPSYESVCISFLESLLNDAPVVMNQGPSPEQSEELLLAFLDQVMRDSRAFEDEKASGEAPKLPLTKRPKMNEIAVQHEPPKHNMATQSFVSLKAIDPPRALVHIAPRRPGVDTEWQIARSVQSFALAPRQKERLRLNRGDHFQFPPSLRVDQSRPPPILRTATTDPMEKSPAQVRKSDQETDAVPRRRLRIEPISDEVVTVRPENKAPEAAPEPKAQTARGSGRPADEPRKPQRSPPRAPPTRPVIAAPRQPRLPSLMTLDVAPLGDIEELSNFNMESIMHEIETSSDGDGYGESGAESGSLPSSKISELLDASSVGHYSRISVSGSGGLSSGEIPDSQSMSDDI
jgi:hypothetical protein